MLKVYFNLNHCYIVHKKRNRDSISVLKGLRKLIDLLKVAGENVCVVNICFHILANTLGIIYYSFKKKLTLFNPLSDTFSIHS